MSGDVEKIAAALALPDVLRSDQIDRLYAKSQGAAWEPPAPDHVWLGALIKAGLLRRCAMRCGFEAFDTGVEWTEAGHAIMQARLAARNHLRTHSGDPAC